MAHQPTKSRKFLAGTVTAALVATAIVPTASAAEFNDTAGNTHEDAINALVDLGVINGYPDGSFQPNKTLSRSDVVKMMGKWLVTLGYEVPADYASVQRFDDVSLTGNQELLQYAALVKDTGVFNGSEGKLDPTGSITRENMALVLVRAFDEINGTDLVAHVEGEEFDQEVTDLSSAKAEARPFINVLDFYDITSVSEFMPKSTVTRGQFATFLYKTSKVEAPVDSVEVASVSAINANKLQVEFTNAVDQEAAKFEVKLGFVPQDVTVEFSEDGKTATLVSKENFIAGDYTVAVTGLGLEDTTFDVKVEAQKLASFTIATDKVTAVATQAFKYTAIDQYGAEFDLAASNFTVSGRNVTDASDLTINGNSNEFVIATDLTTAKDDTVVITLVHKTTGQSQTQTFKVVEASVVDTVTFGTPAPKTGTDRITVSDTSDELVLPISLKDQYGKDVTLTSTNLASDLQFVSSNNAIVDPANFSVVDEKLVYQTGTTAGKVTLTAISKSTGKTATVNFEVFAAADLKQVTLGQPTGLIVADEAVEVTYQAVDTYGKAQKLSAPSDLVWFSTNPTVVDVTTDLAVDSKGKLTITPGAEGTTVVSAFLGGVKQGEITITAKAAAVTTKITKLSDSSVTSFNKNLGTYTYTNGDLVLVDQYNRVIATADLAGTVTGVTVKDGSTDVVGVSTATVTAANDKVGTKTLVATYTEGGIVLTKEFTVTVVEDSAVVNYKLDSVPSLKLYDGDYATLAAAQTAGYSHDLNIQYGLDVNNTKVALSAADAADFLTVTSDAGVVVVDDTTDELYAEANAANNSTATVTAFKKGMKIGEYTYTVTSSSAVLTTLEFEASKTIADAASFDGNTLITTAKNQYGFDVTTPLTGTWLTANSAIASVNASTGVVTGEAAGTTEITFVSTTGVVGKFTVTVE